MTMESQKPQSSEETNKKDPENRPQMKTGAEAHGELARLLDRAEKGDQSALPQLRRVLDTNVDLWRYYGDLALQAEAALGMLVAGNNLLLAEALNRKLQAMKKEIGGDNPSPLERLLVERVTASWMEVNYFDAVLAQAKGASDARIRLLRQGQDGAHRRHLNAVKTLAVVRKLLAPSRSPLQIASRMSGQPNPAVQRGRAGAGAAMAESVKPGLQLVEN